MNQRKTSFPGIPSESGNAAALATALAAGQLTGLQLTQLQATARGQPETPGADDEEIRRRADLVLRSHVLETLPTVKMVIEAARVQWNNDGMFADQFVFGSGWGIADDLEDQIILAKLNELWMGVRNELATGHAINALATLVDMVAYIESLTDAQWESLTPTEADGDQMTRAEAVAIISEAISLIPGATAEITATIGLATGPRKVCFIVPNPDSAEPVLVCASKTFELELASVQTPGIVRIDGHVDPAWCMALPPDDLCYVGHFFEVRTESPILLTGTVEVSITAGPGLLFGTPPDDPGELRLARIANGEIDLLDPVDVQLQPLVLTGSYQPDSTEPEPFGLFTIIQIDEVSPPTDLNGDCETDGADLGQLLAHWGPCPDCPADLNGDGAVDGSDLGQLLGAWGVSCELPALTCPGEGDCCDTAETPGCADGACCDQVCDEDPFCCAAAWDSACAEKASALCGACDNELICPGPGSCFLAHPTPGCNDEACCTAVCNLDPGCCLEAWDQQCVAFAMQLCDAAVCSPVPDADCCLPHDGPGCNDQACCQAVCGQAPFCCESQWDGVCAELAGALCDSCGDQPPCPAAGDCFEMHDTPGCEDHACCLAVCAIDAFCCEVAWDILCADAAASICDAMVPVVLGHQPYLIENGTPLTIDTIGMPMDFADIEAHFLATVTGAKIPVDIDQVHDLDGDGGGDLIEGTVDGIFDTELGEALELVVVVRDAAMITWPDDPSVIFITGNDDEPLTLLSPNGGEGDEEEPATVEDSGRAEGTFEPFQNPDGGDNPAFNSYQVEFPEGPWSADSTYTLRINFYVRYTTPNPDGAPTVRREYYYARNLHMATDDTPSSAECLDVIKSMLNGALATGATDESRALVHQSFEWVREGSTLVLLRKGNAQPGVNLVDFDGHSKKPVIHWRKQ